MSRSGYSDDSDEGGTFGLYRGAVDRAIGGKRGQAALIELLAALDAMPVKVLAAESLITANGEFCTLGVLGDARGIDMTTIDPENVSHVADIFGIAPSMVREIVFENDDDFGYNAHERPEQRWTRMRCWVASQVKVTLPAK